MFRIQIRWIWIQVRIQAFLNLDPDQGFIYENNLNKFWSKNIFEQKTSCAVFLHKTRKRTLRFQKNLQAFREIFNPEISSIFPFTYLLSYLLAYQIRSLTLNRIRIRIRIRHTGSTLSQPVPGGREGWQPCRCDSPGFPTPAQTPANTKVVSFSDPSGSGPRFLMTKYWENIQFKKNSA
jgi:hypothetical protein